jgi:hypothetical protein
VPRAPLEPLEQLFANLSAWRPLPGYSVERRIDLLLSPYLPAFLSAQMKAPVRLVAAEFPVPRRSAGGAPDDNLHLSADFLCLREGDAPAWILVELKTDRASRRGEQDLAYRLAASRPKSMRALLADLKAAKAKSAERAGYSKIYWTVKRAGSRVDAIELCYVEPRGDGSPPRKRTEPTEKGVKLTTWSLGLGELAASIDARSDPLGALVGPLLRGVARSDKARRPKRR